MKTAISIWVLIAGVFLLFSCQQEQSDMGEESVSKPKERSAKDILGNPSYPAISYGGYREKTREVQPTIVQLKDDMKILAAMGVGLLRTYNVQLPHASNVLEAIRQLRKEDPSFEMS